MGELNNIGDQIAAEFLSKLEEVKLDPDEAALVQRVADRLAALAVPEPGATDYEKIWLGTRRDLALASLANLSVAKGIEASTLLRQSAYDVLTKLVAAGIKVGVAFLAAESGESVKKIAAALALLASITFAVGASAPQPATQPARSALSVNLNGVNDWDPSVPFINVVKSARPFGTADVPYDEKAQVDADGNPIGDFGLCALTNIANASGAYTIRCDGKIGSIAIKFGPASLKSLRYDATANVTTAEVDIPPTTGKSSLYLAFTGCSGVKNLKVLRPGYSSDDAIFTNQFVNLIQPFGAVRCMDWLKTNGSGETTWDSRPKVTDAQWTRRDGIPYEVCIALANRAGKDLWINVPAMADDEHVRQLGAMIRRDLRPDLFCYVEYGNELWNTAAAFYPSFKYNLDRAKAAVAAGDIGLTNAGENMNETYWAWKNVAKRAIEVGDLLGRDKRIGVVLATQVSYQPPGYILRQQLEYVAKYKGRPSDYFVAVSGAPYFSATSAAATQPTLTTQQYADMLYGNAGAGWNDNCKAFKALADKYGLDFVAYEGGIHDTQFTAVQTMLDGQRLPRTGQAVETYLNNWFNGGGGRFFYFVVCSTYTQYGVWGLTDDPAYLSPKYQAAVRVASTRPARVTVAPTTNPTTAPTSQPTSRPSKADLLRMIDDLRKAVELIP